MPTLGDWLDGLTARTFKLAMAQMLVEGGEVDANLHRAAARIREAAEKSCEIVVLPETLDAGWTHPSARELAQPIPGAYSERVASAAKDACVHVVAGLTERSGKKVYNTAVLISPAGEILLKHRKINVLEIAQDIYATGDGLAVAETPLGTIGVNICADNFPDALVLGHSLARMGAQMILSPCAWAVDADHDNAEEPYGGMWRESYTALARLYDITVVGVSNVGPITGGPWESRKCIGCSLAVGPGGETITEGPYGEAAEAMIVIDVQPVPRKVTGTAISGMLEGRGSGGA